MTSLGEKIRQMRRQRGMTQSELGTGIVSASMMSQIESGRTRPSYTLLSSIADKLDMPVEYFLDDFEDHFTTSARLQLAEFWFLVGKYDRVLEVLTALDVPDAPGADYFQYRFLLARVYRVQGKHNAAIQALEELREQALKTLDNRVLFLVMKESGHVEAELENPLGAKHEWTMALDTGESLKSTGHSSQLHLEADMAEICMYLHQLERESGDEQSARKYLQRAVDLTGKHGHFQDIAKRLVEDGVTAITKDPSRAKSLIDTGVNLIQVTTFVEQHVLIQSQASLLAGKSSDPWKQAAMATATLHPDAFIQGEVDRIEYLLETGDIGAGLHRIQRCFDIIEDYQKEDPDFEQRLPYQLINLRFIQAKLLYQTEDTTTAVNQLTRLVERPEVEQYPTKQLEMNGLLLKWLEEDGDGKRVAELENRVSSLLRKTLSHLREPSERLL